MLVIVTRRAHGRQRERGLHLRQLRAPRHPARPRHDALVRQREWQPGAKRRHATGSHDRQHGLAEKMTECRRMCKAIEVNTEARPQATLDVALHVRQLATEGGRGLPVEKCPVAGEMHSVTQLLQRPRTARAAAAEKTAAAPKRL